MNCPQCSVAVPQEARFCPQCGVQLVFPQHPASSSGDFSVGWGRFFMSLGLSLALTLVLTLVFHLPIFILGATLPLFWMSQRKQ
jgi:hypothetical protein